MTQAQFKKEFDALYRVRTLLDCFADGGGDDSEIEKYRATHTPYEAVTAEIDRYGLDDHGHGETEDTELAKSNRWM
jgi:hypothetical protein